MFNYHNISHSTQQMFIKSFTAVTIRNSICGTGYIVIFFHLASFEFSSTCEPLLNFAKGIWRKAQTDNMQVHGDLMLVTNIFLI